LISHFVSFYKESLFNPHWGEEVHFQPDNTFDVAMVFQRLDQRRAQAVWQPFLDWLLRSPQDFTMTSSPTIVAMRARDYWDGEYLRTHFPKAYLADDRPDAPRGNVWSAGDAPEASQFMHGHASAWLPASLLNESQQPRLVDALFASSRHWAVSLHCNKGLAGCPTDAAIATRDTAMNPAVLDAFALAICSARSVMSFPNIRGREPDLAVARQQAVSVDKAIDEMFRVAPAAGAYVSEDNYFQKNWQRAYWGLNYPRLVAVKRKYDPTGLFFVHHGIGSEEWTADGFTRLDAR
jgi:FAD/FMN-containing dehydrogenase